MDLVEEGEHVLLDVSSGHGTEWSGKIGDEMISVSVGENFFPKGSWLLEVGVGMGKWVATNCSTYLELMPSFAGIFNWTIKSIWFVVWSTAIVTVGNSCTISNIRCNSSSVWAIDWNLLVVLTESMSMSIWVGEESSLEHLVHGWFNTWDQMTWRECRLLCFSMVVFWVSVQSHFTNSVEWIVTMWPNLGDIENIESIVCSIFLGHKLNLPSP